MSKYIDAEKLTKDLERLCDIVCPYSKKQRDVMCKACLLGDAFELLDNQPAADVEEVRHGRWVKGDKMADYPRVPYKPWETYCSCCGEIKEQSNDGFCGNCGTKMDEVGE